MATESRGAHADFLGMLGSDTDAAANAWEQDLAGDESFEDDSDNQGDHDANPRNAAAEDAEEEETSDLDPEDQDTEEEDDDSEGEEDDEEDDESDEEDQPAEAKEIDPATKVKVKVDGEEVEVTYDELRQGYSRTQDYTRKTQELADQRKKVYEQEQQLSSELKEWQDGVKAVRQHLNSQLSGRTEAQWASLYQEDPHAYYEAREQERQTTERLQAADQADQQAQQEQQKLQQQQYQRYVAEETEALRSKLPEWVDREVANRERSEIIEYGQKLGFTEQELLGAVDHRMILVLRDAAKLAKLQESRAKGKSSDKIRNQAKKPLRAGSPKNEPSSKARARKSKERLKKTGSVQDAASYFESTLE